MTEQGKRMSESRMEILAPAGSRESLERAQAAGADAVYLGYSSFSARAGAGNFDREQLEEALRFAHLHGMRVYVTVNTLVKDRELEEVYALLQTLNRLQADGVLIQDLGVLRMAAKCFPALKLHASTQMAIHNETGVRFCAGAGLKRVVLARECSLEEIRRCAETGMEIEVFCHGAQCVSVSGECLFSSMVGERSGNRGRCAQPCRKIYSFDGLEGAWLSPRDLCLRDRIPELRDSGAVSLKIEGRLKRPEYVYTVTRSYREALDGLERGAFRKAAPEEKEELKQIFHRGGFMEGYAFGAEDAGVIQPDGVNHQGLRIGTVTERRGNLARVLLERKLGDGDGLRIRHGSREWEMTYAGKDTPAGATATLRLREGLRAEKGDTVFRLTEAEQLRQAMEAPLRKIPVSMELDAWPDRPLSLRITDGEREVTGSGEMLSPAVNRETTPEEMEKQLRKTGATAFEVREISIHTGGAFVPMSAVSELRRRGLEALAESRIRENAPAAGPERPWERETGGSEKPDVSREEDAGGRAGSCPDHWNDKMWVIVRNRAQADRCRREETVLIWYPEDFRREALEALMGELQPGDWLKLPEVCGEETLQEVHQIVENAAKRLGGVLLGSVGQLGLRWPVPVAAGSGIPVMNREAVRFLREQGCVFVTASPELSGAELRELRGTPEEESKGGGAALPVVCPVWGRTQLMLLHHCPARTARGWSEGHRECRLCDVGDSRSLRDRELTDERGYSFPLQRIRLPEGCLIRLLNSAPTDLGDRQIAGPRMAEMTTESAREAEEILNHLMNHEKSPGQSTRGHWIRPVL